jgi:hypothetical protein
MVINFTKGPKTSTGRRHPPPHVVPQIRFLVSPVRGMAMRENRKQISFDLIEVKALPGATQQGHEPLGI